MLLALALLDADAAAAEDGVGLAKGDELFDDEADEEDGST